MGAHSKKVQVHLPWDAPILKAFNGDHPLPSSLIASYERISLDRGLGKVRPVDAAAANLRQYLTERVPNADANHIANFVASRDAEGSQARMGGEHDLLFLHTAPLTFCERPFFLHVEELLTLFTPFTWHGQSAGMRVQEQPYFPLVKAVLEHPKCRAVFSHLPHSVEWIGRLFDSPQIAAKTHHIPIGLALSDAEKGVFDQGIAAKIEDRDPARPITFLFTNSWAQAEGNFVLRGGMEVVTAFAELVKTHPNCRLILRSALPVSYFGQGFQDFVSAIPQIEHLTDQIDQARLFSLLAEADGFLLPSCGLHTVSLLRAMAAGTVLIASDAPGVDAYVVQEKTGVIVEGRLGKTAWYDDTGFLNQTFEPMFKGLDPAFVSTLLGQMRRVVEDADWRRDIALGGRAHVARNHAPEPWQKGFEDLVVSVRGS